MKPVGFNYPPVIKRGNGTSLMDDLPMKKPPFSARIFQLATFDDTRGYSKTGKTIEYPIRYPNDSPSTIISPLKIPSKILPKPPQPRGNQTGHID